MAFPLWNDCCRKVADRWWLVAGLRRVGTCDVEDRCERKESPAEIACEDARLTSLLGGNGDPYSVGNIGTVDRLDQPTEGDCALGVDVALVLWEDESVESLRNQEDRDFMEPFGSAGILSRSFPELAQKPGFDTPILEFVCGLDLSESLPLSKVDPSKEFALVGDRGLLSVPRDSAKGLRTDRAGLMTS